MLDHADVLIDLGTPVGDALVGVDGLDTAVAPGSSVAAVAIVNEIKAQTAQLLVARGAMQPVLTSAAVVGAAESARLFDAAYDEYARRLSRVLRVEHRAGTTRAPDPIRHRPARARNHRKGKG